MYNKSEIMKKAWTIYKSQDAMIMDAGLGILFGECLTAAWNEAKAVVCTNTMITSDEIEAIENELFYLSMKDRFSANDYERDNELRTRLNALRVA